jgi:hypothetical protein
MPGDVIGELTMRVAADISDAERKIGQKLPEDLERSAQRVRDLQSTLGSSTGAEFGDLVAQRVDRASRAIELAKSKASELTATLASLRVEQGSLIDFATRATQGPQFITPAEVQKFSPILASGRLEQLTGTDKSKGLIEKTEAALGSRLLQIGKSQDRLGDLLAQQLAKTTRTTELAAASVERDQVRVARGFGQGLLRGVGGGLGIPLTFGLATAGGLIAGEAIGKAFSAAQEQIAKTTAALASLRAETGLSVDDTARMAAGAEAAGVSVESLSAAVGGLQGKGIAFDDAIAKLRGIEDGSLRAAEATRLFGGEQAKAIAPLLTGGFGAETQRRAQELAQLQRLDQVSKALEQRSGGNSPFIVGGLASIFNEATTRFGLAFERQRARARAEAQVERNPLATFADRQRAADAAEAAFDRELAARIARAQQIDRDAEIEKRFSAAQYQGTQALKDMSAASAAADQALGNLGNRMTAAERATLGLSSSISERLRAALDPLTAFGALDPDISRALDIALKAELDPASTALIVQQLQGIGDFASSTITDAINKSLGTRLTSIGESRLQSLLGIQEQRASIAERIADIEERITERHQQNAKLAFDFSKAELDAKVKDREEEKAFFAFRERGTAADTAKADERDRREIAKLQAQLAASERVQPDLDKQIAAAQALRDTFASIADVITGASDITVNHKLTFSVEGGPVLIMDRGEARKNKDLLLGIFGESWAELMITAATGGKRIVQNTRPDTSTVPVGGGNVLTP